MKELLTSEVLDLAADAIQMAGWGTGADCWTPDRGTGLCIEGGIAAVADIKTFQDPAYGAIPLRGSLESCPAYVAVREYLDFYDDLYKWNDRPERTAEEVIGVLRAAAAVERTKEHVTLQQPLDADKTIASGDAAVAFRGYDTEDQPLPLDEKAVA